MIDTTGIFWNRRVMAEIYAVCGGRAVYGDVVELTPEVEKMRGLVSCHPLGKPICFDGDDVVLGF